MKKQLILGVLGFTLFSGSVYALGHVGVFDGAVELRLGASVIDVFAQNTKYNIRPSKTIPGAFTFDYKFEKVTPPKGEANFDLPIAQFDEKVACKEMQKAIPGQPCDFGKYRDDKGYPLRENAYQTLGKVKNQKTSLNPFHAEKALASDNDPSTPGLVNCRANTDVTGYFKAYFEDVALNTNTDYDDPTYGQARRNKACQVLQDIATLIKLDTTTVTPDILFMKDPGNLPSGALAAASAYTGSYSVGPDNGTLHKHIISHTDPTPGAGNFDAFIITNFNGISWNVDSTLNAGTYDFYTVLYHETLHALGFRGLLSAVITSTGDAHTHGTFEKFTYKDSTLSNPFFAAASESLQAPIGAPSSWFITNTAVYRGVKNIVGTSPDGIRPVFSPGSWQQGSSLSHFDMNRSNGAIYVMNPSIPANTYRNVHNDEKEVFCHLGYMVNGMSGCESSTPVAVDDVFEFSSNSICIPFLLNDMSFNNGTVILQGVPIMTLGYGSLLYYTDDSCGSVPTNANNARSLKFTMGSTSGAPLSIIKLSYRIKDSVSGRISNNAEITLTRCIASVGNYVCNGDFEQGVPETTQLDPYYSLICGFRVVSWCNLFSNTTSDYFIRGSISPNFGIPENFIQNLNNQLIDTYSGSPNNRYVGIGKSDNWTEGIQARLRSSLISGNNYILSYYVRPYYMYPIPQNPTYDNPIVAHISDHFIDADGTGSSLAISLMQGVQILNPIEPSDIVFNQWNHIEIPFTSNSNYNHILLSNSVGSSPTYALIDDISIIDAEDGVIVPPDPTADLGSIRGVTYSDQNGNGTLETGESNLGGVQTKLFVLGSTTPIQTTTTQNIPHLGEYTFSNLADGTYYVALGSESVYPSITQPATNTNILNGYSHVYQVTVAGGQIVSDKNFGVVLTVGDLCPNLADSQSTIPVGYELVNGQCTPILIDLCPNIRGIQTALPVGYELIDGQCIPTVDATVDMCPNIAGIQTTVPAGYTRFLGKCFQLINADTVTKFPKIPVDPVIIDSTQKSKIR